MTARNLSSLLIFLLIMMHKETFPLGHLTLFQNLSDTIEIKQSKSNTRPNYYCKLIYRRNMAEYVIYNSDDPEIDLSLYKSYRDSIKYFVCYNLYSEPSGSLRSILFDRKDTAFYITNAYNLHAKNDAILMKSVSFEKRTALVLSEDDTGKKIYYKIRLTPYGSIDKKFKNKQ